MFTGSAKGKNKAGKGNDEGLRGVGGILILKSQGDACVKTRREESCALLMCIWGKDISGCRNGRVQEPGGRSMAGQPRISMASETGVN